jgi:hypothetical protein
MLLGVRARRTGSAETRSPVCSGQVREPAWERPAGAGGPPARPSARERMSPCHTVASRARPPSGSCRGALPVIACRVWHGGQRWSRKWAQAIRIPSFSTILVVVLRGLTYDNSAASPPTALCLHKTLSRQTLRWYNDAACRAIPIALLRGCFGCEVEPWQGRVRPRRT